MSKKTKKKNTRKLLDKLVRVTEQEREEEFGFHRGVDKDAERVDRLNDLIDELEKRYRTGVATELSLAKRGEGTHEVRSFVAGQNMILKELRNALSDIAIGCYTGADNSDPFEVHD